MNYYIYIITNWNNKVLYTGVTNNLERRMYEHIHGINDGFSKKYKLKKLVYFEETVDINAAIEREKKIKNLNRKSKEQLIESKNPNWDDLYLKYMGLEDGD